LGNGHVVTSKLNSRPFMGVGGRVGVTPPPLLARFTDIDIDCQDKIIIGTY